MTLNRGFRLLLPASVTTTMEATLPETPQSGPSGANIVTATGLTKIYGEGEAEVRALDGVDVSFDKGVYTSIMGPSGSGKSTLMHVLAGLDTPTTGRVEIEGTEITGLDDGDLTQLRRDKLGFVFQFFNLLPTLSAEENIALPLIIDGKNLRQYRERIDLLLELVGLSDRRHHKPDQLSGGEQQRVAIARALVTEPAIVLADEPTGNLDSKTGTIIMQLLRRSCDEFGQAIIAVTHDARAAAYADRVVFLRDGSIVKELHLDDQVEISENLHQIMTSVEELES